jgi:hypothetical protein
VILEGRIRSPGRLEDIDLVSPRNQPTRSGGIFRTEKRTDWQLAPAFSIVVVLIRNGASGKDADALSIWARIIQRDLEPPFDDFHAA